MKSELEKSLKEVRSKLKKVVNEQEKQLLRRKLRELKRDMQKHQAVS